MRPCGQSAAVGSTAGAYRINPLSFIAHEAFIYQWRGQLRSFRMTGDAWSCLREYYHLPSLSPRARDAVSDYCSTLLERGAIVRTDEIEEFLRQEKKLLFFAGHDAMYFLVAAHRRRFPYRFEFDGTNPVLVVECENRPTLSATGTAIYDGRSFAGESVGGDHLVQTKPAVQFVLQRAGYRMPEQAVLPLTDVPARKIPFALSPSGWIQRLVERELGRPVVFPLVVKPWNLSLGQGVTTVHDWRQMAAAVRRLKARFGAVTSHLLIQPHVPGPEYRVSVLGDGSMAACRRTRFTVRGDGRRPVRELVARENCRREEIVRKRKYWRDAQLVRLDGAVVRRLAAHGVTLDTILPRGRQLAVTASANAATGGLAYAANHLLSDDTRRWACAVLDVLGVDRIGIDLIGERLGSGRPPVILEVNARSSVALHEEPDYGEALPWGDAILRYFLAKGLPAHTATVMDRHFRSAHPV